jgi:hypothetical protein
VELTGISAQRGAWGRSVAGRLRDSSGQGLIEFAIILPLTLLVVLGVVETGYALFDQHVVTKVTREGSNLISRDTSLEDAVTAMASMSTKPVDLDENSRLIFSVIRRGATVGSANFDHDILYQRHEHGALTGVDSVLQTHGLGSFGPAPDFVALNSDADISLRVTNLPANIQLVRGGMLYVTELYTRHRRITPLDRLGISIPEILYSVAYF